MIYEWLVEYGCVVEYCVYVGDYFGVVMWCEVVV